MTYRSALLLKDRSTLIHDVYQQVDRLILTDAYTFNAITLQGFHLKSTQAGLQNQPITSVSTVTTDTLIVVHARNLVHVNAEMPGGNGRSVLLLTLDQNLLGQDDRALLGLLESTRADPVIVITTKVKPPPQLLPDGTPKPSRTAKAREAKKAKRDARLAAAAAAALAEEASASLGVPSDTTEQVGTRPDIPSQTPTGDPARTPTPNAPQAPRTPETPRSDKTPRTPVTTDTDRKPTSTPGRTTLPGQDGTERRPRRTPAKTAGARSTQTSPNLPNLSSGLNLTSPEPPVLDLPIVPIERRDPSASNLRQISGRAPDPDTLYEEPENIDDIPEDLPF